MNRLKYILGVKIFRRVPSKVTLSHRGQRSRAYIKSHRPESNLFGLDSLSVAKRNRGTGVRYTGQFHRDDTCLVSRGSRRTICKQRGKTKPGVIPLKESSSTGRKLSLGSIAKTTRHYSTYQNVKFNSGGSGKRHVSKSAGAKNINRNSGFVTSAERQPRSYAEMIADYCETAYKASAVGVRNDSLNDTIRKSPFSTLSTPFLEGKIMNITERSAYDTTASAESRRNDVARTIEGANKNLDRITASDSKSDDNRTYANPVGDFGKSTSEISLASVSNGAYSSPTSENVQARKSVESVVGTTRKAASGTNARESWRRTSPVGAPFEKIDGINKIKKRNLDSRAEKHSYSQLNDKSADSSRCISDATKTFARKSSTQLRADGGGSARKSPQVELHMVPSAKESVVSINVDSDPLGLSDSLNSARAKELSVVVKTDQKRDSQPSESQWNITTLRRSTKDISRCSDFGPMRISISEESAPVKQIEFSINGKPVSELKSITARTERLDVVSSVDKIEIRIPYAKDDAASKTRRDEPTRRTDPDAEQILNVQISANFQKQPVTGNTEPLYKAETTSPTPSQPVPKTHYVFKDGAKVHSTGVSNNDDARKHEFSVPTDIKPDDTIEGYINATTLNNADSKVPRREAKIETTTTGDVSSIEKTNSLETVKLHPGEITDTILSAKTKKHDKNKSSDESRIPSNMIPWWSSSDCFSKIKKKEDDRKPTAPSNINEKKAIPDSKRNFAVESSVSKSEETSTPSKILSKKTSPANNTIFATTNNSTNLISRLNSLEQRGESEPTAHYPSLFGLKPKRKDPKVTKVTRSDAKTENSQVSIAKKDEEISETKQTSPVASRITSAATNTQNRHDESAQLDTRAEKTSVLPSKFEMLSIERDILPKSYREEKFYCKTKRVKSIDGVSSIQKLRTKNILGAIKPIEKKKDGTLIDYGLKVSSKKPTDSLDDGIKDIQDLFAAAARTEQETLKKFTTQTILKKEQIDETTLTKQTELDKTKISEIETNVLEERNNLIVKKAATSAGVEAQKKNDTENSSRLKQMIKKKEKLADNAILQSNSKQHLKSFSESNKERINRSNVEKLSEKLGTSTKTSEDEWMKNRSKDFLSIRNISEIIQPVETKIPESKGLKDLTLKLGDIPCPPEGFADQKKSLLGNIKGKVQIKSNINANKLQSPETKPNKMLKIKNRTIVKKSTGKDAKTAPIAHQFTDKSNRKVGATENTTIKIPTQGPAGKNLLSKDCEEKRELESDKDKGNSSESAGSSKKPNDLTGLKSSSSKFRMKFGMKCNSDYVYGERLLFTESSYADSSEKTDGDVLLNFQPFETVQRNANNADSTLENYISSVNESAGRRRIDTDRPEKNILYSVWLQQPKNDINNNEILI